MDFSVNIFECCTTSLYFSNFVRSIKARHFRKKYFCYHPSAPSELALCQLRDLRALNITQYLHSVPVRASQNFRHNHFG